MIHPERNEFHYKLYLYFIYIYLDISFSNLTMAWYLQHFSRFLRTVSSDSAILPVVAAVMQNFGWSWIALLTQTENLFTFVRDHLAQ